MNAISSLYKSFWKKSKEDNFFVSKPYTQDELNSIENILGYKIPDSYKELMLIQNGGVLKRPFFPLKNTEGTVIKILRCDCLFGLANNNTNCLLGEYNNTTRKNGKTIGHYNFEMDGFQFGEWCPNSGWGNTYIYFDYSLCGPDGEPRVCAYEMKWSPQHNKACPINYIIASDFNEFIEGLISKPKVDPFDFDAFEAEIVGGVEVTLNNILKDFSCNDICAFGLYTDDGSFISTAFDTKHDRDVNDRFITSEWTNEGTFDADAFSDITSKLENHVALLVSDAKIKTFRNKLIDSCANALLKLKNEGFFLDKFGKEIVLMVGTSHGDMASAKFKQVKKVLNK